MTTYLVEIEIAARPSDTAMEELKQAVIAGVRARAIASYREHYGRQTWPDDKYFQLFAQVKSITERR